MRQQVHVGCGQVLSARGAQVPRALISGQNDDHVGRPLRRGSRPTPKRPPAQTESMPRRTSQQCSYSRHAAPKTGANRAGRPRRAASLGDRLARYAKSERKAHPEHCLAKKCNGGDCATTCLLFDGSSRQCWPMAPRDNCAAPANRPTDCPTASPFPAASAAASAALPASPLPSRMRRARASASAHRSRADARSGPVPPAPPCAAAHRAPPGSY